MSYLKQITIIVFAASLNILVAGCGFVLPPLPVPTAAPTPTPEPVKPPTAADFEMSVVATGLDQPWEITYGPDDHLWVTERMGKRVLRVNPVDGQITPAATIHEAYANLSQEGLLGMVLHPELLQGTDNDFVYVAYTYALGFDEEGNPTETRAKIRRYRFDTVAEQLVAPVDILADLPASIDHNGGRLTLGPDNKLIYPIGDQGAGNFTQPCRANVAQILPAAAEISNNDWRHYVGKMLRLNLDGSIPADNPVWNGVQSHVYSIGHRNVQGMVAGNGQLYASEHGPKTDDEVNQIIGGGNYGWPHVAGYQDDTAYVFADWAAATIPCDTLEFSETQIPDAVPQQLESEWNDISFVPPLYAFGTVASDYNFADPACDPAFFICWPTIAPTGMEYYAASSYAEFNGGIPTWTDSLLVAALKTGTIYRLPLDKNGHATVGEPEPLFQTINRYRDLAIAPDGQSIYIITDVDGLAQDASGLPTDLLEHPGAILVFRYLDAKSPE